MKMRSKAAAMIILAGLGLFAQQSTDYLMVEVPIGSQSAEKALWVKWAGVSRGISYLAPDSGIIYYDRAPGGGDLANYRYTISTPYTEIDNADTSKKTVQDNIHFPPDENSSVFSRGTAFRAEDQPEMGYGVFYCVVAWPMESDTFVSNEFQLMIESPNAVDWKGPTGEITSVTPTFQWETNPGVPYYHLILSDEAIEIDTSGEAKIEGLSIIWQAITPATQITYGAPDPSKTITADPPPLSPGQNYTWIVMNNYGNHPAFSSTKVKIPPGEFTITGETMNTPECVYPINVTLNNNDDRKVMFKWKNLDADANTYKIYIYVGSDFEGIDAQLVVYQTEVVADGREGEDEIDSVEIDAASVLTGNKYVWKVIAVNDKGAGTVGDTAGFHYEAPVGSMRIYTREQIVIGSGDELDTVVNPIGLVELKVEVLDGSLEAPLLFYTDNNGYLDRERPTGVYRVTAIKSGFEELSRTITVKPDEKVTDTFFLVRPDATVFGKVIDGAGKGINLASVYGISDRGDTVTAKTDAMGSFVLNCYAADWSIGFDMTGYTSVLPEQLTVESAENYSFGTVVMEKNPFTLSGNVQNSSGDALLGVRVRVYQDGVMLSEVPSTPQNGAFSFTLTAGTYTVKAEKTGFSFYSKSVDVLSSKKITIALEPGATLVKGYVYGVTWVGEREVVAPITNASIVFVDSAGDSVSVVSDPTYGDYGASLKGNRTYEMYSSAKGFLEKSEPITVTTKPKKTMDVFDTLQGLGMISGKVTMSESGDAVGYANVSLVDPETGDVASSGKSSLDGTFELKNIPDGLYEFSSAKEGLVLDSVAGNDTVTFDGGKADRSTARIYLEPGDKTLKWEAAGIKDGAAAVKMQSPLVRTLSVEDSITSMGPGLYIVSVDADDDSVVDLSYHRFSVADSEEVYIDTVLMNVIHAVSDTIEPEEGNVTLSLRSARELDSVVLFYKDAVASRYREIRDTDADTIFTFEFIPPKDGSTMLYYFTAYKGTDIYGYNKEVYNVYVLPDLTMLTRFEVIPSSDDVLSFPSEYEARFQFKGYVSSAFIPDTTLPEDAVSWALSNRQGCVLENESGLSTIVTTGNRRSTEGAVELEVTIDTTKIPLSPDLENTLTVGFTVSGASVLSIEVLRNDAGNTHLISSDQAEFIAQGYDKDSTVLDLSPVWTISPRGAGNISEYGVFKPADNFAGIVRVFATVGKVSGEYMVESSDVNGLNVRYMIVHKSGRDTVTNGQGCSVIFPPEVVGEGDVGLLEIVNTSLKNRFRRGYGKVRSIDTLAFDIQQIENVVLNLDEDSIRLVLDVPESMQDKAASGKQKLSIARWVDDSIAWSVCDNSVVSDDGSTISAGLTHFSCYSIVYQPADRLSMDIAPNPFSPYIIPTYNPYNPDERVLQHNGACFRVQADISESRVEARLKIYSILGDLVCSYLIQNADNLPYYIWWDGRTTVKEVQPDGANHVIAVKGDKMCRNGRYFAVFSAKINGKNKKLMKHLVLMK